MEGGKEQVKRWLTGVNRRVVSLALMYLVACVPDARLRAQAQVPGSSIPVTVVGSKGVISGTVASSSGRPLRDVTMQLVNPIGAIVGTVVTARTGEFRFQAIDLGMYTVQCVADKKVTGTSSVTLSGPLESVKMICAADPGYWKQWGLLTVLGVAAATLGTAAIVGPADVASPSR
jgi:hypothetical protein